MVGFLHKFYTKLLGQARHAQWKRQYIVTELSTAMRWPWFMVLRYTNNSVFSRTSCVTTTTNKSNTNNTIMQRQTKRKACKKEQALLWRHNSVCHTFLFPSRNLGPMQRDSNLRWGNKFSGLSLLRNYCCTFVIILRSNVSCASTIRRRVLGRHSLVLVGSTVYFDTETPLNTSVVVGASSAERTLSL